MLVEFIVLACLALFIFYKWSISKFDYFEKRNIPFDKPFPLLGCQKDIVMRKASMYENILRMYKKFDTKVFGAFDLRIPVYVVRDPSLLKQIKVKHFDHFVNHPTSFAKDDSSLFANALSSMNNERWKDMRSTLSPIFTGSKLRQMFVFINEVASESIKFLKTQPASQQTGCEINSKDYFTRFTNDVIASAAFGITVNSFVDKTNEFYVTGKKLTNFSALQILKLIMYRNYKYLMDLLKIKLFDDKITGYFSRLVLDAMRYRVENKIVRPDMIHMLMEARGIYINEDEQAKPAANREWNDHEIVAQCFFFFFAGFDTSATLMALVAQELMENPDIQARLRQEIIDVKESLGGKVLTYDALHGMKYMDMVVSETLRKWPVAVLTDRKCNKDFSYKDDQIEINIKAGDTIWIPIVGLHLDEQYFPNPNKFDPERFSDENKGAIQPFTYIPFGTGPRNCIGNRFALMEVKAVFFYLLSEFRIEASPKATIPMELAKHVILQPKDGYWVKLVQL